MCSIWTHPCRWNPGQKIKYLTIPSLMPLTCLGNQLIILTIPHEKVVGELVDLSFHDSSARLRAPCRLDWQCNIDWCFSDLQRFLVNKGGLVQLKFPKFFILSSSLYHFYQVWSYIYPLDRAWHIFQLVSWTNLWITKEID